MPKCPECGEEIESLIGYERIERKNVWTKDGMQAGEACSDDSDYEFVCPKCGATIFRDPDEVRAFLRGVVKWNVTIQYRTTITTSGDNKVAVKFAVAELKGLIESRDDPDSYLSLIETQMLPE